MKTLAFYTKMVEHRKRILEECEKEYERNPHYSWSRETLSSRKIKLRIARNELERFKQD